MKEFENRLSTIEMKVEKHDEEIKELKLNSKDLAKAIQDNTTAQVENTVTLKEYRALDEERYRQSVEVYKELNDKLEEVIKNNSVNLSKLTQKIFVTIIMAVVGGFLAYTLNF